VGIHPRHHLAQFLKIRETLGVDPQRMFSNTLLDRVLFDNPALATRQPQVAGEPAPVSALAERL
jgi:hypothetical protein